MLYRCIAPDWALKADPTLKKVVEGHLTKSRIEELNAQGYNIYWLPNSPSRNVEGSVQGSDIDVFDYVFVDMDLKDGVYKTKQSFIDHIKFLPEFRPSFIIDSGGGVHVYWLVKDLDAKSYLRLTRRLARRFKTDEAVGKLCQLMRAPDTYNTKEEGNPRICQILESTDASYTCEELDQVLPAITKEDEEFCQRHYDQTHKIESDVKISDEVPHKFLKFLKSSKEAKTLYAGAGDDRSKDDYRLAHLMFAEGFTKSEATSVLMNCRKAENRSPQHRQNYAVNIVDKIWTYEATPPQERIHSSVRDVLRRGVAIQGTRFRCHEMFDSTHSGFRRTQVLGLIGGAGSGKTTLALNYFYWFTLKNPTFDHIFVSLEQPEEEIAQRWANMVGENENLHDKVHIISNYNSDGSYRNLSLHEIQDYIMEMKVTLGIQVGCVVIDHVGVLKKQSKDGENQGLMDIFHHMKAFAKEIDCFLVMQSQTSREKAGIGDLELDKDAAYGSSIFEWYCDYILTTWQPLKRIYDKAPDMACSGFKYCKIRHKHVKKDKTKEDVVHVLMFDPDTELLRPMTQEEEISYEFYNTQATTLRNKDRKREPTRVTKIDWVEDNGSEVTDDGNA